MQAQHKLLLLTVLCLFVISAGASAQYSEAPMLSERVATGELPPLEERLPAEPFVLGQGTLARDESLPDWQPGRYGGTLPMAHNTPGWSSTIFLFSNEPLVRAPGTSTQDIQGNVLRDFDVSEDNKVFTFYLREGLRWSDGVYVTTEDVRFTYEHVLLNEELTPFFPPKYRAGGRPDGEPMQLEILDEYTFRITFDEPYGAFLSMLAVTGWSGYTELIKPSHVLKDYHIDFTSLDAMAEELAEEELDDEWYQLFTLRDVTNWELTQPKSEGFPVLYAWKQVEGPAGFMTFRRNPYYFKVDTEGQQLPYIDELASQEVSTFDAMEMQALVGEIDFFYYAGLPSMPMYQENRERGDFDVRISDDPGNRSLFFNLTYDDPTWRSVVRNPRFREAINMALDREEMVDAVIYGFAPPLETVPDVYDPEQAAAILDEIGMDARDSDGNRLAPNGEPFEIYLEVATHSAEMVPLAELVVEHLREIDIDISMRQISAELWGSKRGANELMASILWTSSPTVWRDQPGNDYIPNENWAPEWFTWHNTGGESGEEPPEEFKRLFELQSERMGLVTHSPEDQVLIDELFAFYEEKIPFFILFEEFGNPVIVSNDLANVPVSGSVHEFLLPAEQFYYVD